VLGEGIASLGGELSDGLRAEPSRDGEPVAAPDAMLEPRRGGEASCCASPACRLR
jgi:hypothetical protein